MHLSKARGTERIQSGLRAQLLRLDACELDDLGPLLSLGRNVLTEVGGEPGDTDVPKSLSGDFIKDCIAFAT